MRRNKWFSCEPGSPCNDTGSTRQLSGGRTGRNTSVNSSTRTRSPELVRLTLVHSARRTAPRRPNDRLAIGLPSRRQHDPEESATGRRAPRDDHPLVSERAADFPRFTRLADRRMTRDSVSRLRRGLIHGVSRSDRLKAAAINGATSCCLRRMAIVLRSQKCNKWCPDPRC